MDHSILVRRPELVLINKKKKFIILCHLAVLANHRVKMKEDEKIDKYADLTRELKKAMEQESDGDTNRRWSPWNNPYEPEKEIGRTGD